MKRGEVWWTDFAPSVGGEIGKKRPAIIISNDAANAFLNRVQVVPVTPKIDKLHPSEAYVTIRGRTQKAAADQITTVSKGRLSEQLGRLVGAELARVEQAVRVQLGLDDSETP